MISIIIPVYNAEKYINRCLESVVAQTYNDWEMILVNDGSKDHSLDLCQKFAKNDCRIKVLDQENQGANKARRNGWREAKGEWVTFVDADDYIPKDALENLLSKASEETDIVLGWMNYRQVQEEFLSIEEYRSRNIGCRNIDVGPVAHLYRRRLYNDFVFDIPRELTVGEDNLMNIRLAFCTNKPVMVVHKTVYHYDMTNDSSAIHTFCQTIEYEDLFHRFRLLSVPIEIHLQYIVDLIGIRVYRLLSYIRNHPLERQWYSSDFTKTLLADIENHRYPLNRASRGLIHSKNIIIQIMWCWYFNIR